MTNHESRLKQLERRAPAPAMRPYVSVGPGRDYPTIEDIPPELRRLKIYVGVSPDDWGEPREQEHDES